MVRKAVVVLSTLIMLAATQALAVGLGTLELDSALNQPLQARIQILDLGNVAPETITVTLASTADFNRFNVDRIDFLLDIEFRIETNAAGTFLYLSTEENVREPFLGIILDTRWPNGRILSEHTVLLDLPVFNDSAASPGVSQPLGGVPEPAQGVVEREATAERNSLTPAPGTTAAQPALPGVSAPAPEDAQAELPGERITNADTASEPPQPLANANNSEELSAETIDVEEADTLWGVALRVRPSSEVSVHQTMLAIQRLNPQAFPSNNINLLRAGEVLRIPDLSEIQSLDQQQAVSEVVRQNQQANLGAEPLAAPASGPSIAEPGQLGQLSVVTVDEIDLDNAGAGGEVLEENAELDARIQALADQLAVREEEADRVGLIQEEMVSRLDELDAQIASSLEIVTLQDLQLARLQESLAETAAQAAIDAEAVTETETVVETDAELVATQVPEQLGLVDDIIQSLSNNSLILLISVIVVVLLLVTLLVRRSRAVPADFDVALDELSGVDEMEVEHEQFVAPEQARERTRFTPSVDLREAEFDPDFELERVDTVIVEAQAAVENYPELEVFDETDEDLHFEVEDSAVELPDLVDEASEPEEDIYRVEKTRLDTSAVAVDELLDLAGPSDKKQQADAEPLVSEGASAESYQPTPAEEFANKTYSATDQDVRAKTVASLAEDWAEERDNDEGYVANSGQTAEHDESTPPTEAVEHYGTTWVPRQIDAATEPASGTVNEVMDPGVLDFDLDDFFDESEQSTRVDEPGQVADVDFNLEEFEDEFEESDLGAVAEIDNEVEGFDPNDIDNNVEVLFDLTDKQDDSVAESADADQEVVEFSTETKSEPVSDSVVKTDATQIETVNFDVTNISELEESGSIADFDSADKADQNSDTATIMETPLVFSVGAETEEPDTLDEKAELFEFELEELEEIEHTVPGLQTEQASDLVDDLVVELEEENEAATLSAEDRDASVMFAEISPETIDEADTFIDEPELADLSLRDGVDATANAEKGLDFDIFSVADTASATDDDTFIEGVDQAESGAVDREAFEVTAIESVDEGLAVNKSKLADSIMAVNEIDEMEELQLEGDVIDSDFDDIRYHEPSSRPAVLTDIDDLEFLSADAELLIEGSEDEFDFLSDDDESATKLDLAYAYQKMGDFDGAREILEEVMKEGNEAQSSEAKNLLEALHE